MRVDQGAVTQSVTASNTPDSKVADSASNASHLNDGNSALVARAPAQQQTTLTRRRARAAYTQHKSRARQGPASGAERAGRQGAIDKAEQSFKQRIAAKAQDRHGFHQMMKHVYGNRYDEKTVETLRNRALSGDFSFLPKARFVSDSELQGNYAAYDAATGTILLNEKHANNPQVLADYYSEEAGHHMDTLFGAGDAVGDEGELLRNVLAGTEVSAAELAAIRAEDDKGSITVDGKTVEVEFGFFKKIKKKVKKGFKKIKNGIKKAAKSVWSGIKKAGKWLMTSTIGNMLITGALAAFTVITAGAGSAAMIAWEAGKQALLAVGRSVLVQKAASFVAKATGSETLGRIAGMAGAALGSGKVDFSSAGSFAKTAGTVAKDIAANEAKRAIKNEVVSHIGSPYLQTLANFAVDKGVDAAANYAYQKAVDYASADTNKTDAAGKDNDVKDADKTQATNESNDFSIQDQAQKGLAYVANTKVSDVAKALAPKELAKVLETVLTKGGESLTLGELAKAVKEGLNDFQGMSARDVALAVQDYAENLLIDVGNIDRADVTAFAQSAFQQAGQLRVADLVRISGYGGTNADQALQSISNLSGTNVSLLTLDDLFRLATSTEESSEPAHTPQSAAAG